MTALTVELREVTKVFTSGRGAEGEEVYAVRDMTLGIHENEFFTLLGPSGCGKTTTLRLVAGFETPTQGEVLIQGEPMSKVPPNRRPINTVFQNYALFPHLSVLDNVAFGLAVKRVPRAEREQRAEEALALVQLAGMGNRKPGQLSGGQQQRVALARALVNQPAVLLLDEPLGALDLKLRKAMQIELKHLQEQVGITFIYVTHDQEEALIMSDRIAVMSAGVIQQVGDPIALYEEPATHFVADFIGESNFLKATVEAIDDAVARLRVSDAQVLAQTGGLSLAPGQAVTLFVRPEKLSVSRPEEAPEGGLVGAIQEAVYIGTDTRYVIELASGEPLVARCQNLSKGSLGMFAPGDRVCASWSPEDARTLVD
jgi:spermidine/putrescine transport system ATP-binding protein